jgi:ATP-binding cassette subfamily B protein
MGKSTVTLRDRSAVRGSTLRALAGVITMAWRSHRVVFLIRLALTVLAGLVPVAAAWLLRAVLDTLAGPSPEAGLMPLIVALALVGAVSGILPNVSQYLSARSGRAFQRHGNVELFTAVTRLTGLRRLEDPGFQNQLSMAQQAGRSGPGMILAQGTGIVSSALTLAGFLVALIVLSPLLAGIVVAATVPELIAELGIARRRAEMVAGLSHAERRQIFYANLLSSHAAAKEIRLFRLGPFFQGRMLEELRAVQRENERVDRRELGIYTLLGTLTALVTGGGLWWAISQAAHGALTVGDVSLLVSALLAVSSGLAMIINNAAMTYQALLMFRAYQEIVDQEPDLPVPARAESAGALRHGVEFDGVWFRYGPDQPWVLRGVSMFLPPGEAIALVGHNGAGKSTVVKLLCRFYDPDRGRILWDGTDLRDVDPGELRDRMSVVFQDYMTYELNAAENVAVGDLSLAGDAPALAAAAGKAGMHDTIAALPKGYQTLLTRTFFDLADKENPETGVLLSGGQWQRLALARAFLRGDRDLVILDEPSSGLDAEAEHEIHSTLRASRRGHATLLISHRLNTVREADHIVVLVDGVVAEQGDHATLMACRGTYARLFALQAKGFAADAAPATAHGERNGHG